MTIAIPVFFGRFKEAGPARPVNQVKLYDQNPTGSGTGSLAGATMSRHLPVRPMLSWLRTQEQD